MPDMIKGSTCLTAIAGLLLLSTGNANAQPFRTPGPRPALPPPSSSESPPALTGTWLQNSLFGTPHLTVPQPIPFQPWAEEIDKRIVEQQIEGLDPHFDNSSFCLPMGPIDIFWPPYTLHIFQTEDMVLLLDSMNHERREIFMNAEHPDDLRSSYLGHSVGRWEGNTLVVDTIGFNDLTPLSTFPLLRFLPEDKRSHLVHSNQLHLIERWTLSEDGTTLTNTVTIEDPQVYTAPFDLVYTFQWRPDLRVRDDECNENNGFWIEMYESMTQG